MLKRAAKADGRRAAVAAIQQRIQANERAALILSEKRAAQAARGIAMGEGSSSGITPMEVSKYPTSYNPMPITRRAMVNAGGGDTADDFKVLSKK